MNKYFVFLMVICSSVVYGDNSYVLPKNVMTYLETLYDNNMIPQETKKKTQQGKHFIHVYYEDAILFMYGCHISRDAATDSLRIFAKGSSSMNEFRQRFLKEKSKFLEVKCNSEVTFFTSMMKKK